MGIRFRSPFTTSGRVQTPSRLTRPPVHRARPRVHSRPKPRGPQGAPQQRGLHYPWESTFRDWQVPRDDGRADYSKPFRNHPLVYRAIQTKASAAAAVELKIGELNNDGEVEAITSGIEYETLMNPSRDLSTRMMQAQIIGWMQMAPGEAFLWIIRGGQSARTQSRRLRLLSPEWIQDIDQAADGTFIYEYRNGDEKVSIPEQDMIHFMGAFNPYCPGRGIGPLQAAAMAYQDDLDVRSYNRTVVRSGGMPAGFLSVDGAWPTPEEREVFKQELRKISREQQKVVLVGGTNAKWQSAGQTPEEMAFVLLRRLSFKEIGGVFGVAPQYLGDFERDQADAEIQAESLHVDTMRGEYRILADILSMNLWKISGVQSYERGNRKKVAFLDDSMVPTIQRMTARAQEVDLQKVHLVITPNEFRKKWKEGDPRPDGDSLSIMPTVSPDDEDPSDKPAPKDEGKAHDGEYHEKALAAHVVALEQAPMEARMVHALSQIYRVLEAHIVDNLKAVTSPEQKAPVIDSESVREPFDIAEIAARIATDTTPILRAAQRAGGLRGLKLARQHSMTFKVNSRPAVEYLSRQVQAFAVDDATRTFNRVIATLRDGVAKGEPDAKLVERVRKVMEVKRSLAQQVSQTQVNAAYNGGTDLGFTQSEVVLTKTWLTGANPRETHAKANRQEVPVGKKFRLGHEEAAFPGDPNLSDEEKANCNCTLGVGKLAKS